MKDRQFKKNENDMSTQLPDRILRDGEWMDLYSNPLEQYWIAARKSRPPFYPRFNCKRGYVATWEIKENRLFLNDIVGSFEKRIFFFVKKSASCSLKWLFPGLTHRHKLVKATWFSGKLRIPIGKMMFYEHNGYDSRFEKEQIITVDHGNILKVVILDNVEHALIVQ
jgi:hypothetical protein